VFFFLKYKLYFKHSSHSMTIYVRLTKLVIAEPALDK